MSQRAKDLDLPMVWHLPPEQGPARSACGWREEVMRGEKPREHDHRVTHNIDLCNCVVCASKLAAGTVAGDPALIQAIKAAHG